MMYGLLWLIVNSGLLKEIEGWVIFSIAAVVDSLFDDRYVQIEMNDHVRRIYAASLTETLK